MKELNLPVDKWYMLLLHLLEKRMDQALRKQWELVVHELDIPTSMPEQHRTSSGSFFVKSLPENGFLCKGEHTIHRCSEFVQKDPQACFPMAKDKQLCVNCLQTPHQVKSCPSTNSCRFCNARHNKDAAFPIRYTHFHSGTG
ncbi:hypothetical protein PR048_031210 [Dryococelus australis]|uniref:Uncharacterized protein n=1 Tax=Dryococelus australis TaxID=614101 RepID=A0ABQ9G4M0_9NEOP|nr:hypothetical protein PR048_031210 [Dryococelus australis]